MSQLDTPRDYFLKRLASLVDILYVFGVMFALILPPILTLLLIGAVYG